MLLTTQDQAEDQPAKIEMVHVLYRRTSQHRLGWSMLLTNRGPASKDWHGPCCLQHRTSQQRLGWSIVLTAEEQPAQIGMVQIAYNRRPARGPASKDWEGPCSLQKDQPAQIGMVHAADKQRTSQQRLGWSMLLTTEEQPAQIGMVHAAYRWGTRGVQGGTRGVQG